MLRKEEKQRNAYSLSSRTCEDCRQCMSIGRRDGDPTRLEVYEKLEEETKDHLLRQPISFEFDSREWPPLARKEILLACQLTGQSQDRLP